MGNESSQQVKYGQRLENDVKVSWKKVDSVHQFPSREGHCAAAVPVTDTLHKLYVFGGLTQSEDVEHAESNDLLVFDPEELCWSKAEEKGSRPPPRFAATLAAVGKKLFLFGGLSHAVGWFQDVHVYDTETKAWTKLDTQGVPPRPRDKLASAVIGDKIYIFGGFGPQGVEEDIPEGGGDGGEDDEDYESEEEEAGAAQFGWFNDLFIFDTSNNSWSSPMQMNLGVPTPRAAHTMCAVDKYLVIFGGRDSEARRNDLHIFDTETRKWTTGLESAINGREPDPRSFHTMNTVDHRVVVMGGRGVSDQHYDDFHIFDTKSREWLQPAVEGELPGARGTHSSTVVGGHLVLFGGSSDFSRETMQCQRFHNDTYVMKTADISTGSSVPKTSAENQENISSKANVLSASKAAGLATINVTTNGMDISNNDQQLT